MYRRLPLVETHTVALFPLHSIQLAYQFSKIYRGVMLRANVCIVNIVIQVARSLGSGSVPVVAKALT